MIQGTKTLIISVLFLAISACGYTPIFSKKAVNFNIESIEFSGDSIVGQKINQTLSNYKNKKNLEQNISLIINGSKERTVVSKNLKGEAQVYKIRVTVKMKAILGDNNFFKKNIEKSTTYSSVERKSQERLLENKLVENLSDQIARQIILDILEKTK